MRSWRARLGGVLSALAVAASVAYPFAVYFADDRIGPLVFVAAAIALIALRLVALRAEEARRWRMPLLVVASLLLLLASIDLDFATRSYPLLLSLAAAGLFGWSLLRPPSLIERLARIRQPDLPPAAQRYCRRVTVIWTCWLVCNAGVAGALAAWGSVAQWALWTGVVFYVVSGALLAGEYAVRHLVRRRGLTP